MGGPQSHGASDPRRGGSRPSDWERRRMSQLPLGVEHRDVPRRFFPKILCISGAFLNLVDFRFRVGRYTTLYTRHATTVHHGSRMCVLAFSVLAPPSAFLVKLRSEFEVFLYPTTY